MLIFWRLKLESETSNIAICANFSESDYLSLSMRISQFYPERFILFGLSPQDVQQHRVNLLFLDETERQKVIIRERSDYLGRDGHVRFVGDIGIQSSIQSLLLLQKLSLYQKILGQVGPFSCALRQQVLQELTREPQLNSKGLLRGRLRFLQTLH